MYKGIFWLKNEEIVTVKVRCDGEGNALEDCIYSSKSGENFNHKAEWAKLPRAVTEGRNYNYYPRGRVEVKNQKAVVWLSPALLTEETVNAVRQAFALNEEETPVAVKADNSNHYRPEMLDV